jgi:hypothetical protein
MMTWTVAAPAISAAFLSSLVEAVEALTIVLAVGTVRGWRPAGLGADVSLSPLCANSGLEQMQQHTATIRSPRQRGRARRRNFEAKYSWRSGVDDQFANLVDA